MILAPLSQWMHGYLLKVLHFNTPFKISFFVFSFFKYSSEWKYMASVHCHIHYSSTLFSLVQVYASELVDSISVFLPAAD